MRYTVTTKCGHCKATDKDIAPNIKTALMTVHRLVDEGCCECGQVEVSVTIKQEG